MSAMRPASASSLEASLTTSLYTSGKYSDLTIKCQGRNFKVHRAVVCYHSKVLAAAVDGDFKEAHSREIDLDDSEPDIVAHMIKFIYTQHYDDGSQDDKSEDNGALLTNVKIYIMGDKYDIQPLKVLAAKKYEALVPGMWNTPPFAASLKLLYDQTLDSDRIMKDLAIKIAGYHATRQADRTELLDLCQVRGDIAYDVLKFAMDAMYTMVTSMSEAKPCPYCPISKLTSVKINPNPHDVSGCLFHPGSSSANAKFYCSYCEYNFN